MVTSDNNPGILDFQDAVAGPLTYDLVSLLKDCYVTWPAGQVSRWADSFYDRLDETVRAVRDREAFHRDFALMGVQRHLKAAGIFARLNHRDGKPGYMQDIPRTLAYVLAVGEAMPGLGFLCELIEEVVLPGLASAP
jgi:aminoglycoside/choline kinase family phosphotransferase